MGTTSDEFVESRSNDGRHLNIIHFNDCYNVEPSEHEPVGGAARFVGALQTFHHLNPLVLFSGDIIAPSIMSTFTKGEQMLPVLEKCKVDCALFGNHEFDFGLEYLVSFAKRTTFPWLMSNVFLRNTTIPLGEGQLTYILHRNEIKIGLVGLIEEEWLSTLVLDPDDIEYYDFITEGRKLARQLKENDGVDIVIALTHMRTHNDIKLAENVEEIDLILGGHDHDYDVRLVNGKYIIKSGTDFRQFSKIDLHLGRDHSLDIKIEAVDVTSKFTEDSDLVNELDKYKTVIEHQMDNVIAYMDCDLDGRFASIRSKETNLGNLMTDVMLDACEDGDFALLNSGTMRSDRIHLAGPFKMRDLVTILPYMESNMVINITSKQIHLALENGVSQYPKLEGRFPQVSGLCFAFDPSQTPGSRVPYESIRIGRNANCMEPLQPEKVYRMVTKEFIAQGKDGYDVLKQCHVHRSTEECMSMTQAVQEYFEALRRVQHIDQDAISSQSLPPLDSSHRKASIISLSRKLSKQKDEIERELPLCHLCPQVQGRIKILNR